MNSNNILQKSLSDLTKEEEKVLTTAMFQQMESEIACHDRGGLYGYTQRRMAYNSNRIEGSTLTEDETAALFETGGLYSNGEVVYRAKDIEEMNGHFLMFNHMMRTLGTPLSEQLIKDFHYQLTSGVFEFRLNGYVSGEYKTRRNTVAGIVTSEPVAVQKDMRELLSWYQKQDKNLQTLSEFHIKFETIHPFQDGNGRTGRMILFRECMENGIIPFIIQDYNKTTYYNALKAYQSNKDIDKLVSFFRSEQAEFYERMQYFMYDYSREETEQEFER